MDFGPGSFALAYAAGLLSVLSPCVLPLLPIVLAAALQQHRHGPLALALGLTLSFTAVALFAATLGFALGLDAALLRRIAALLLIGFGAVLVSARLQALFTRATAGIGSAGEQALARMPAHGVAGQFALGLLLGLVWTPCVGPTLGAASSLAAQGTQLPQVAALMGVYGLGAGTPLLLIGRLSTRASPGLRHRLAAAGRAGRRLLGVLLVVLGIATLAGWDKRAEAALLRVAPEWLNAVTTRF